MRLYCDNHAWFAQFNVMNRPVWLAFPAILRILKTDFA